MKMYKLWLLENDAGTLVHVSDEDQFSVHIKHHFPEYEVTQLRPATTERTFRLNIRTETVVTIT